MLSMTVVVHETQKLLLSTVRLQIVPCTSRIDSESPDNVNPMLTTEEKSRLVAAFDRLHNNGDATGGEPVQCYEWASVGTFNLGS